MLVYAAKSVKELARSGVSHVSTLVKKAIEKHLSRIDPQGPDLEGLPKPREWNDVLRTMYTAQTHRLACFLR